MITLSTWGGKLTSGSIDANFQGAKYRLKHEAPLYANVLMQEERFLVMPTDQSGGLITGENQSISLTLREGAEVLWAPAASTVVYPAAEKDERTSQIETHIEVHASSLYFLNRVMIPCRDSRLSQLTRIHLSEDSKIIYCELHSAGRVAHDEAFVFESFGNDLRIMREQHPIYIENYELQGAQISQGMATFQGATTWGVVFASTQFMTAFREIAKNLNDHGAKAQLGEINSDYILLKALDSGSALHQLPELIQKFL